METRRRPSATHGRVALMTGRGAVAASVLMIVAGGVPKAKIAWFEDANTDAKKETVFSDMRSGKVAVLIGSAKKMGTGVNVQRRLLVTVGLQRRSRDVTPDLDAYVAGRAP